ncbi:MAG: ATP-dependent zinc metalloprotease FTSH 4, mitochondrial [Watsoniomyces obsoletus]|nr:MAG: ATP-dependent zinc metalloprotease FTSH 4, mitochondrial [Watsoniomyces obsoletus]
MWNVHGGFGAAPPPMGSTPMGSTPMGPTPIGGAPIGSGAPTTMSSTTGRMKPMTWQRGALPTASLGLGTIVDPNPTDFMPFGRQTWFDPPPPGPPMSVGGQLFQPGAAPHHPSSLASPAPNAPIGHGMRRPEPMGLGAAAPDGDDELIPTAIVIKNIPFAVKKEQLVQLMTDLHLPLPYAFNYHFDHGVFRGLAFANFTTAEETAVVIEHLNHFELQGRKLRVEYKKMLPLQERERIEREKRERRGQLEEQHRPIPPSRLQNQPSLSSMSSHVPATSPSPVSRNKLDVDLNDPQTLQFYSQLLLFRDDVTREALIFPSALSPSQRRTVHTLAHHMGLAHISRGSGEHRQVHVVRAPHATNNTSPPMPSYPLSVRPGDALRRGLNRAATIDFGEARASDQHHYGTPSRQPSGLLDLPGSPGLGGGVNATAQYLRGAKSFADLRSYTPSPVPSTASFPAGVPRYPDQTSLNVGTTGLSGLAPGMGSSSNRDDLLLAGGLGGLSLGGGLGIGGHHGRDGRGGMLSGEREPPPQSVGGPIGSNRSFSLSYDDLGRERGAGQGGNSGQAPIRQPRGPLPERGGPGLPRAPPRQNGHRQRGSDESSLPVQTVEIVVE